ncbi:hypothetical protein LTR66_008846 [Elasticomyces elasticus]|nr:hypothetical protein LTR66_008846 [Elasticomyces elasticus]KAK5005078.1 hypothetical protein LTR28_008145 [Elasticomyces elasticus]
MSDQSQSLAALSLLKRKRAQINYYESDTDYGSTFAVEDSAGNYPSRKKLKKAAKSNKKTITLCAEVSPFPFLALPAELRNIIYDYALTDPKGINIEAKPKGYRRTAQRCGGPLPDCLVPFYPRTLYPALLSVSRQINLEAGSILYKQEMVFNDTMALHTFLAQIGPTNRTLLSHVTLREYRTGRVANKAMNFPAFTLLASVTNLKRFNIDCMIGYFQEPKNMAKRVYRDAHHWFEGIGVAKGDKFAGVKVLDVAQENFDRRCWRITDYEEKELPNTRKLFKKELRTLLR